MGGVRWLAEVSLYRHEDGSLSVGWLGSPYAQVPVSGEFWGLYDTREVLELLGLRVVRYDLLTNTIYAVRADRPLLFLNWLRLIAGEKIQTGYHAALRALYRAAWDSGRFDLHGGERMSLRGLLRAYRRPEKG